MLTPTPDIARSVYILSIAYSLRAVVAPVVTGGAMTATSGVSLMWFAAGVGGVMVGLLLKR